MKLNKITNARLLTAIIALLCELPNVQAAEPTYADGVWTVPANDVSAFTNAFKRAVNGDRIVLEKGVYKFSGITSSDPTTSRLYHDRNGVSITIAGGGKAAGDVLIDIAGTSAERARLLRVNKGDVSFTNLTVTGAYGVKKANGGALWINGGCKVWDCVFTNNYAESGYGGAAYGGVFYKCRFAGNSVGGTGGALQNATSYDCYFTNNVAGGSEGGGAVYGGTHNRAVFECNRTTYGSGRGGGAASAVCIGCTFRANTSQAYNAQAHNCSGLTNCNFTTVAGSSAFLYGCKSVYNCVFTNGVCASSIDFQNSVLVRCTIAGNRETCNKGGFFSGCKLINCLVKNNATVENQSYLASGTTFWNCTVVSNRYQSTSYYTIDGTSKGVNTIFAFNSPFDFNPTLGSALTNCIVTSFKSGTGTDFPSSCPDCLYVPKKNAGRMFADSACGDYHLRPGSAAKGWGLMTPDYLALIGDLDLDGNPRLTYKGSATALDLGCYMYKPLGLLLLVR